MDLLTVFSAAKILNVTPDTVRFYEKRGLLPATRTETGIRLFRRGDVLRLAAERAKKKKENIRARRTQGEGT